MLDKYKAAGNVEIYQVVLELLADVAATSLANPFKQSPNSDKVPREWRLARVGAVHERGQLNISGKFRPSILLEVMKKYIRDESLQ